MIKWRKWKALVVRQTESSEPETTKDPIKREHNNNDHGDVKGLREGSEEGNIGEGDAVS